MTPMVEDAIQTLTSRKAIVTPTAKASMLVATAIRNIARDPKSALCCSSSPQIDSRIIFKPMRPSNTKAIQWSTLTTTSEKLRPSK